MSYRLTIRMVHTDCQSICPTVKKNVIFTQSPKNAKIATIVDNQQQKRNDSNKTMHKKTKNDKQNNLPRRRTKMSQANERRR